MTGRTDAASLEAPRATPAGIYVHVPFCSAVCPYCDFAVTTGGAARRAAFVETLRREIRLREGDDLVFDTVYLGGGTPSLLPGPALQAVLGELRSRLRVDADAWISLEANPEDVTEESARAWSDLGVRTLSLGVQALDAETLRFLGRRHDAGRAQQAVAAARAAGYRTVSLDLIYGLPSDTLASWGARLEAALQLEPDHLSCYQLSMPEGTPFGRRVARGTLGELGEEPQAELFIDTHERLAAAGYGAYEVSNFARGEEHRSRHNRKYWEHVPYLGFGPAAHSFRDRMRWWNERESGPWVRRVAAGELPVAGSETLTPDELATEALMLGLRTTRGADLAAIERRFGLRLRPSGTETLARLESEGLVRAGGGRVVPTLRGLAVADSLAAALSRGLRRAA